MRQKEQEKPNSNLTKNINWWSAGFAKPASHSSGKYIQLVPFSLSVKRTKELRALAGWYTLSLSLSEFLFHFTFLLSKCKLQSTELFSPNGKNLATIIHSCCYHNLKKNSDNYFLIY